MSLLLLDPFGKTDEREPLTNAVRSDSAVIGGKLLFVVRGRRDTYNAGLQRKLPEAFSNDGLPVPRSPHHLPGVSLSGIVICALGSKTVISYARISVASSCL